MKKRSRFYPLLTVDTSDVPAVGQAGGVLLTDTVAAAGLDTSLSAVLAPCRKPLAIHDPGKVVADLALMLALGVDLGGPQTVTDEVPGHLRLRLHERSFAAATTNSPPTPRPHARRVLLIP